jgi:hypothetical protein
MSAATTVASSESSSTDQATVKAALNRARDGLAEDTDKAVGAMATLRKAVVSVRPSGVLTVDEIAEAIGRSRSYVDSLWSSSGGTRKGKPTRVPSADREGKFVHELDEYHRLAAAAAAQRAASRKVIESRAERDRAVVMAYASKILGPSAIAAEVGVDRNHVLRIARKAGVTPVHRTPGTARNQHNPS